MRVVPGPCDRLHHWDSGAVEHRRLQRRGQWMQPGDIHVRAYVRLHDGARQRPAVSLAEHLPTRLMLG
jgi:hypothetical protein